MQIYEQLKYDEKGLIPAIIQDAKENKVLTLCYMTKEAVQKTLSEGKVYVFRRSKGRLMIKGETSGCFQMVMEMRVDCELKSILFKVEQIKAACHEGYFTCYYRQVDKNGELITKGERIFDPAKVYKGK